MFRIDFWNNGKQVSVNIDAANERDAKRRVEAMYPSGPAYGANDKRVQSIPTPHGKNTTWKWWK